MVSQGNQYNNENPAHASSMRAKTRLYPTFGSDEDSLARAATSHPRKHWAPISTISTWAALQQNREERSRSRTLILTRSTLSSTRSIRPDIHHRQNAYRLGGPISCSRMPSAVEAAGVSLSPAYQKFREQMYTGHADLETLLQGCQVNQDSIHRQRWDSRLVQQASSNASKKQLTHAITGAAMGNFTSSTKSTTLKQEKSYLIWLYKMKTSRTLEMIDCLKGETS